MLAALIATRNPLTILTVSLPNGSVGVPYSTLLLGSGGFMPYSWSVIAGSLPPGLTLNSATGAISGTPTAAGVYTFTIQLTDAHGQFVTRVFTITIVAVMYGNQYVAATTTFTLITLTKRAAFLSTNPTYSYQLLFSRQGSPSIKEQLDIYYKRLVNAYSSNANGYTAYGALNNPLYLSNQIVGVIGVAVQLNTIIQSLPVASANATKLVDLQTKMKIALNLLLSLAIPITLNYA